MLRANRIRLCCDFRLKDPGASTLTVEFQIRFRPIVLPETAGEGKEVDGIPRRGRALDAGEQIPEHLEQSLEVVNSLP